MQEHTDALTHVINFRCSELTAERITRVAAYHGRSVPAELRACWRVHDARSTLKWLDTTQAREDLGADGVRQARERVEASLREYELDACPEPTTLVE